MAIAVSLPRLIPGGGLLHDRQSPEDVDASGELTARLAPDDIDVYRKSLVIQGAHTRIYGIEQFPGVLAYAAMHELYYQMPFPVRVALEWDMQRGVRANRAVRSSLTQAAAAELYSAETGKVGDPQAQARYQELWRQLEAMEVKAEPLLRLTMLVQIFARSAPELVDNATLLETWFNNHGFWARVLTDQQDYALQAMAPLGERRPGVGESRNLEPLNIASLYPHGARHYDEPGGIVFGRDPVRLSTVRLDLFKAINTTTVITGVMGAGKSTTVKDMVEQAAIAGDDVSVVDLEGEYVALIQDLGGQIIDMALDREVSVNFLDAYFGDFDDLLPVLSIMAEQPIHGETTDDVHDAWQQLRARRRPAVLSDLVALLYERPNTRSLSRSLRRYTTPPLDSFFNRPTNVEITSRLRCFVLKHATKEGAVQRALLYLTQLYGMQYGLSVPGRSWTFIDESWVHFTHKADAEKLVALSTRARKHGHMVVVVAPNVAQIAGEPAGRTLLQNAAIHVLLPQQASVLAEYQRIALSEIDVADVRLVTNSRTGTGLILMQVAGEAGVRRVPFHLLVPRERLNVYGGHTEADPVPHSTDAGDWVMSPRQILREGRRAA